MLCGKKLKRSLQRSNGIAKYIVRLLERSQWGNLQTEITIHRVFKLQNISTPMRSIGNISSEKIRIGMNMMNAMTARMQIHTIHMK
jgi:hypothetical protein